MATPHPTAFSGEVPGPGAAPDSTAHEEEGAIAERPPAEGERMVIFVRTFDFLAWLLPMTNPQHRCNWAALAGLRG